VDALSSFFPDGGGGRSFSILDRSSSLLRAAASVSATFFANAMRWSLISLTEVEKEGRVSRVLEVANVKTLD
jgi:hypothetical protein